MGMYVGGEIADLARIARPRIGVVTAVQPVHLSRIGSLEAIEAAKGELLEALPPDGTADPQRRRPDRPADGRAGRRRGASATASRPTPTSAPRPSTSAGLDGMRFTLRADGVRRPVTIPTLGRLSVHNALAGGRGRPCRRPDRSTRSRPASRPAGRAPHRVAARPSRRRDRRRRHLQRLAAARSSPRSTCWPGCPAGASRSSARCSSWARRATRATASSARRPPGRSTGSWWSAPVPRGDRRGRRGRRPRPGAASSACRDAEAALDALPPRLRDGDVVLVKASRGIGLDRVVDGLRRELGERRGPMTVELIQGLLLAFALMVILMPPYIRLLHALGLRQAHPPGGSGEPLHQGRHADDGRPAHRRGRHRDLLLPARRARTRRPSRRWPRWPASGALGAFDDYLNARTGEGIRVRQKLIWLTVVAFVAAWQIQQTYDITAIAGAVRRRRSRSTRGSTSRSAPSPSSPRPTA